MKKMSMNIFDNKFFTAVILFLIIILSGCNTSEKTLKGQGPAGKKQLLLNDMHKQCSIIERTLKDFRIFNGVGDAAERLRNDCDIYIRDYGQSQPPDKNLKKISELGEYAVDLIEINANKDLAASLSVLEKWQKIRAILH